VTSRGLARLVLALVLSGAIAVAARYAPRLVRVREGAFIPSSFVTHTVMLVLSTGAMLLLSKGRLKTYGFARGSYVFSPRILMWILPTAVLATASALMSQEPRGSGMTAELTKIQLVAFVWMYASVCEEILTRGLLQTLLGWDRRFGVNPRTRFSMPVVTSALFFGAMHIVLFESMGPRAVPAILMVTLLGYLAARYRERTGSLLPAVMVHALFNVGGMLPLWIISGLSS